MIKETNPWINLFKIWHQAKKMGGLKDASKILRGCAFDTDFVPNRIDDRFQSWAKLGISNYYKIFNKGKIQSFEALKGKYGLNQNDFSRYLCNIKPEILTILKTGIIKVFLSVIISKLYNAFL